MVAAGDVLIAISYTGRTDDLTGILPVIKDMGVPIIALTGNMNTYLASQADVVLDIAAEKEACPLQLAPTASTTAQLALGDALAVALLDARGFRSEDFARSHPGGALGRKLLTHLSDVMRTGDAVPRVAADTAFPDLMREMSAKGLGASAIVDAEGRPIGIFTDGDLRRLIEKGVDLRSSTARDVMHAKPRTIRDDELAESGRGLRIVATVSDDWGIEARADGKAIWFTLALPDRSTADAELVALTSGSFPDKQEEQSGSRTANVG